MSDSQQIQRITRQALLAGAALSLAACAAGPNYKRPTVPVGDHYTTDSTGQDGSVRGAAEDPQRFVLGRDIPFDWWKLYRSPAIDSLVAKALKANPTLPAAQAALRQAQEQLKVQKSFFYPTVNVNFQPTRQQLAGNMGGNSPGLQGNGHVISTYTNPSGPAPYNGPVTYNFFTSQVALSYVPDVFGANRRAVEGAKAQVEQTRFQMEATYITLVTNVVSAAIQQASLNSQIAAARAFVADNEHGLALLKAQFKEGYASRMDLAAQELALAQAKAQLPPLLKQSELNKDLIKVLVGGLPSDQLDLDFDLSSLTLPAELPVSLPAKLLDQRPDVRAAEAQMHQMSAQQGVAAAARLPQFSITAAYGGEASKIGQMFDTGGPFWNLMGDVSQTVFDAGGLYHKETAAKQALLQARWQYRSAVQTAVQNVADTLYAIKSDADALAAVSDAEQAAKVSRDVTQRQFDEGMGGYLVLLNADTAYQQAKIARVQAETNRFGDAATLFQALGGGWWNRAKAE